MSEDCLDDIPEFGPHRTCISCLECKPMNKFIKYEELSGTYFSKKCRSCIAKLQRSKPYRKQYMKNYHRDYQIKKAEHDKQRHRNYYQKHKEEINAKAIARSKTPEGKRQVKRMNHLRRIRKINSIGSFSPLDLKKLEEFTSLKCEYCGIDVSAKHHLDHITPISRGGTGWINNIAITCVSCNSSKHNKILEEYNPALVPYIQSRNLVLFS